MKRTVLFFFVLCSVHTLYAQKKLSKLRLTLDSSVFEEVSSSSLPTLMKEQQQKGENFKRFYDTVHPRNSETNRIYRLKATGEVIKVNSLLNKGYRRHWNQSVRTSIETFAGFSYEDKFVEYLKGRNYRAVIFFSQEEQHNIRNHIMYKNPRKGAYLSIIYISDLPDEVKIKNMREIVKGIHIR